MQPPVVLHVVQKIPEYQEKQYKLPHLVPPPQEIFRFVYLMTFFTMYQPS